MRRFIHKSWFYISSMLSSTRRASLDEYWDIWHRDERIQNAVESILRRGRKLNVHLWIGSQDNQAASIGLAGETKLMKNFTYVCELAQGKDGVRFLHPKKYTDNGRNEPPGEPRAVLWVEMPQPLTPMTYREFIMTADHRNMDLLTQLLESAKASLVLCFFSSTLPAD